HRASRLFPSFPTRRSSDLGRYGGPTRRVCGPLRCPADHVHDEGWGAPLHHVAERADLLGRRGQLGVPIEGEEDDLGHWAMLLDLDRKSTRLNSSHGSISYA